eukprot:4396499-Pyramimonas_sp.AAC.1
MCGALASSGIGGSGRETRCLIKHGQGSYHFHVVKPQSRQSDKKHLKHEGAHQEGWAARYIAATSAWAICCGVYSV